MGSCTTAHESFYCFVWTGLHLHMCFPEDVRESLKPNPHKVIMACHVLLLTGLLLALPLQLAQ